MRIHINSLMIATAVMLHVIGAGQTLAADNADTRLQELNLVLPDIPVSVGNYVGVVQVGNLLYVSGNTHGNIGPKGKLGHDVSIEQGYESSKQIALRELSIVRSYLGSLNRVKKVLDSRTKCNAVKRLSEKLVRCLETQSLSRAIIQQVLNNSKFGIGHR